MNQEWYVYIIQSEKDGTLYTGITNNIRKRIRKHNDGNGARYTRGRGPWKYRAARMFPNKGKALKEEAKLKGLSRKDKLKICLAHSMIVVASSKNPKTAYWLINNFDENVEQITISVDSYRELSRNNTEHLAVPVDSVEKLKRNVMGTIFGMEVRMLLSQKSHLTKATYKNGITRTLCDDHGWCDESTCTHDECMVREVHDA